MLLGGLRRCEVLGVRLEDLRPGEKRVFIAEGKGGHQRIVPLSTRFFSTVAAYLETERPRPSSTDRVFVVLKGPRRGQPLTAAGMDEIVAGARTRAGLERLTCHQLRHTCFTRLREAGMALEAIQAQAGHRSIESTRLSLHLANDWLAGEYRRAAEAIDAQAIAALLGHKTLAMTMVYARIADKTVADEYFAVTEKVEALYHRPRQLPADAEGTEMRRLRAEMHRRMLGNGYCARPVEMDCHFESICESCTFFVTTIDFRPTLQKQRDDAERKGQVGRQKIFDGLLTRLHDQEDAS